MHMREAWPTVSLTFYVVNHVMCALARSLICVLSPSGSRAHNAARLNVIKMWAGRYVVQESQMDALPLATNSIQHPNFLSVIKKQFMSFGFIRTPTKKYTGFWKVAISIVEHPKKYLS